MPQGSRSTAGINTTRMQQKHRGRGLENKIKSPLQAAKDFLRSFLADGPVPEADVKAKATENGIIPTVLGQARALLDIKVGELEPLEGEQGGVVGWALPEAAEKDAAYTIDRLPPGEDEFTLTPEERRQFGIKDNEQHGWIRDDRYWGNKVPGNRAREFCRQNPGGRIVTMDGEPVTNGTDLVLTARPLSEVAKRQAMDAQREEEHFNHIEQEIADDDEFDTKDRKRMEERKHANTLEHVNAGMIGPSSPSSGVNYEDYIRWRNLTPQQIEEEERSYSLGRFYGSEPEGEAAEAAIAAARKQNLRRDGGGKFISIPATVRPRNLATRG